MWVKEETGRKQHFEIRLPLACLVAYPLNCVQRLLIHLSLPPSTQTAPRVQTFWCCFCRWQERSCSLAWRRCSSGNCWSPSTTDGSSPNLRKNALVLSGTRSVNLAVAACVCVCKCCIAFETLTHRRPHTQSLTHVFLKNFFFFVSCCYSRTKGSQRKGWV